MGLFGFGKKKEAPKPKEMSAQEMIIAGINLYEAGKYKEAFPLVERAAQLGQVNAQGACGVMYAAGQGVKADMAKALYWYEKAAEQGLLEAQKRCAGMYYDGVGSEADRSKALYWHEKVAEQGDLNAQLVTAQMYSHGEGTQRDMVKALKWYERAAEQENTVSMMMCSVLYCGIEAFEGQGDIKPDLAKARMWCEKALAQGEEELGKCPEALQLLLVAIETINEKENS